MDPQGNERRRLEGYLPRDEFEAWLKMSLARLAFVRKDFVEAQRLYGEVAASASLKLAPEAVYYRGVSEYSAGHDHTVLGTTAQVLKDKYEGTEWQMRSIPWLPAAEAANPT